MVHHNPYESFPNTVVINPSKSSSEIQMDGVNVLVENSQYELDFISNMHEGSFGDRNYDKSRGSEQ